MPTSTDGLLTVTDLSVHYSGQPALRSVNIAIAAGECVGIVGANGAGKSTLARTIAGLVRPAGGQVSSDGVTLTGMRADKVVRRGLAFVPEGRALFTRLTVLDNLLLGGYTMPETSEATALDHLGRLFPELVERKLLRAGQLSGGQQQMLAIARALMAKPKLLLLDEPSLGLAPLIVQQIFRIIKEINQSGATIFLVEQNAHMALTVAHRGYVIQSGRVILADTAANLLENPDVKRAYLGG